MKVLAKRVREGWGVTLLTFAIVVAAAAVALTGGASDPGSPAVSTPDEKTAASSGGGTLFVSPTGSDAGGGASPFRTIGRALEAAGGGETIEVRGGTYPPINHTEQHSKTLRVVGAGSSRPRIEGAVLAGAAGLRFKGLRFTAPVLVRGDPVKSYERPSAHIIFTRSSFRTGGTTDVTDACVTIRDHASYISVVRSRVHDCFSGLVGPGNLASPPSHHITIERNLIEDVPSDAIQFGDWDDVTINRNTIRHMRDPAGEIHNDGVQFVGDSRRVRITSNRIYDSGGQLVFIQDAFGPIDDVLIQNNLIHGSGAIAIQNQGATDARYLYNTVWDTRYGALLLRPGMTGTTPGDTVVVGNILESFEAIEGADTRYRDYNLVERHEGEPAPHELVNLPPGFRKARLGNYRLREGSPAVKGGNRAWAPGRDIEGRLRGKRPSLGAFELVP